jgi:hypothetical protein
MVIHPQYLRINHRNLDKKVTLRLLMAGQTNLLADECGSLFFKFIFEKREAKRIS